jgi:hypothetical protein
MANRKKGETAFLNNLKKDDVYVENSIVQLSSLTGMPSRKGLEQAVISNGKVVNVISDAYGHLSNETFFRGFENALLDAGINFDTQSINRGDRTFAVDYILSDDSYHVNVKTGKGNDKIRPIIRGVNAYDGSGQTTGYFGLFREICTNGLHISDTQVGFKVLHRKGNVEIILPEIKELVTKFMNNEFYSLHKKFQVLSERPVENVNDFVKFIAGETSLFKYEISEKNPEPTKNAQFVLDIMSSEANVLGSKPNLWLGYNAFNEWIHKNEKRTFETQRKTDTKLFDTVLEFAGIASIDDALEISQN